MATMAPQCGGWVGDEAGHRCTRKLDDGQDDGRWLVLLGTHGQPCYFFCPQCEDTRAEWIERQLGPQGEEAGCTGMARLESGSPGEVLGMIRGIPDETDEDESTGEDAEDGSNKDSDEDSEAISEMLEQLLRKLRGEE